MFAAIGLSMLQMPLLLRARHFVQQIVQFMYLLFGGLFDITRIKLTNDVLGRNDRLIWN